MSDDNIWEAIEHCNSGAKCSDCPIPLDKSSPRECYKFISAFLAQQKSVKVRERDG
jgi:hypothetical protein